MLIKSQTSLERRDCEVNYMPGMFKFPSRGPFGDVTPLLRAGVGNAHPLHPVLLRARVRACRHLTTAGGHSPLLALRRRPGSPVGCAAAERDGGWRHGWIRVPGCGRRFPPRLPAADAAVLHERRAPPPGSAGREGAGPAGRRGRTQ